MDRYITRMSALAPSTMRRLMMPSAQTKASRNLGFTFMYPHSGRGNNNVYNHYPVNKKE